MSVRAPESQLWNILRGGLTTRALALVADLRVADALAAGPRPVEELAREVDADPDTLHRLLRALASDGVFAEEEPGIFRNNEASEVLRGGDGWDDFAHLFGGAWLRATAELDAMGEPPFPRIFGTDFWSWLAEHPDERAAFDRAMLEGWERRVERLSTLDWRGDEVVVDVGGGNGSLLVALLQRQPGLRGVVFDLPETNRDEAALGDRVEFVAGDFFERVPPGDVYVLSTILHDWDDERAAAILRTIRASALADARLLVLDSVIPPGNEPHGAKWLDLLMLTLFAGRERDEAQWRKLLAGGGFEPVRIQDGLIEARCHGSVAVTPSRRRERPSDRLLEGEMNVVEVELPAERSRLCEQVLRDLPEWFGIEEATAAYIRDVAELPTFRIGDDALLSLKLHTPLAAEVYVMGVRRAQHGQGLGTTLLRAAEAYLRARGVEYLQVKTLGPSDPDAGYAKTRSFYLARGFVPLEEIHGLWEHNPCLLLVKRL